MIDTIPVSDLRPKRFKKKHILARRPAIISGVPPELAGLLQLASPADTDLSNLVAKCGDASVLVEPVSATKGQFGSGEKRIRMTMSELLTGVNRRKLERGELYLTTQYAEDLSEEARGEDEDEEALAMEELERSLFPEPVRSLLPDIPLSFPLAGDLILQQTNLWLGGSPAASGSDSGKGKGKDQGTSSGLHHDFHDNFYVLLRGRKRFVLFPPKAAAHLAPYGKVDKVHPNGLISYKADPTLANGLSAEEDARYRVKAIERAMRGLEEGEELERLREKHEGAMDEMMEFLVDEAAELEDDFDGLGEDDLDDEDDGSEVEEELGPNKKRRRLDNDNKGDSSPDSDPEPDSFSRIPVAELHAHLGLAPESSARTSKYKKKLVRACRAYPPEIVELEAGQMLYLPASWWHEVTSLGGDVEGEGDSRIHMALNYWYHPPMLGGEEEQVDRLVEEYRRGEVRAILDKLGKGAVCPDRTAARQRTPIECPEMPLSPDDEAYGSAASLKALQPTVKTCSDSADGRSNIIKTSQQPTHASNDEEQRIFTSLFSDCDPSFLAQCKSKTGDNDEVSDRALRSAEGTSDPFGYNSRRDDPRYSPSNTDILSMFTLQARTAKLKGEALQELAHRASKATDTFVSEAKMRRVLARAGYHGRRLASGQAELGSALSSAPASLVDVTDNRGDLQTSQSSAPPPAESAGSTTASRGRWGMAGTMTALSMSAAAVSLAYRHWSRRPAADEVDTFT